tara:strand:- start:1856 stop:3532 length:1677 start_codon:yes stop_codon:yes gene_type:complete
MPFYKFEKNDKFFNIVKAHPKNTFSIWSGSVFYNNQSASVPRRGALSDPGGVTAARPDQKSGYLNLFEANVNRRYGQGTNADGTDKSLIVPFRIKDVGDLVSFKNIGQDKYFKDYNQGDTLVGSYPLTSSITRIFYNYGGNDYRSTGGHEPGDFPIITDTGGRANRLPNDTYTQIVMSGTNDGRNPLKPGTSENPFSLYKTIFNGTSGKGVKNVFFSGSVWYNNENDYPHGAPADGTNLIYNSKGRRRRHLEALKNTLNYYSYLSPHYKYISHVRKDGERNFGKVRLNMISVPSIFYGSSIKKGTVFLKYYVTGTLVGELGDIKRNGELIQVGPTGSNGSGSVAGVVLYNEGVLLLTASHDLTKNNTKMGPSHTEKYIAEAATVASDYASWLYWGASMRESTIYNSGSAPSVADSAAMSGSYGTWLTQPVFCPSSSFSIDFEGTNHVNTMTMFAHAPKGVLNHSNNLTYLDYQSSLTGSSQKGPETSKRRYIEYEKVKIKNTTKSQFKNYQEDFEKQVYISKIGIYDKDKNLIGVAKLANPVKKKEDRDFTFKIKLDI